jgi:hypothetical protein
MRFVEKLCVILAAAFIAGCGSAADSGPPNMMNQVLGALQIPDAKERDTALAEVCRDSASQGSAPTVLMALPKIEDVALRDLVAEECAGILGGSGHADAAAEIANLITNEARRDEVLARLDG